MYVIYLKNYRQFVKFYNITFQRLFGDKELVDKIKGLLYHVVN